MNELDLMRAIGGVKPVYLAASEKKRLSMPAEFVRGVKFTAAAACLAAVIGGVIFFARGMQEHMVGSEDTTGTTDAAETTNELIGEITANDVGHWYVSLNNRLRWSGVLASGLLDIRYVDGEVHPLAFSYEGEVYIWDEVISLVETVPATILAEYIAHVEAWCEENGYFLDYVTNPEFKDRYTQNVNGIIVDLKGSFTGIVDESDENRLMDAIKTHNDKKLPILVHVIRELDIPREKLEVYAEHAAIGDDSMLRLTDTDIDVLYSGDDELIRKTFCADMAVNYNGRNFTVCEFMTERTDLAKTQDILPDESKRLMIQIDGVDLPRWVVNEMYEKVQAYAKAHNKRIEPALEILFQSYEYAFADRESFEGQLKERYREAMAIAEGYFYIGTAATDHVQVKIGGEVYNRVIHYETLAALESEVRSYFSEELTKELFSMRKGDYIDYDGRLYARVADGGTADLGLGDTMYHITKVSDTKYVYSLTIELLDYGIVDDPDSTGEVIGYQTYDYVYENIGGRWVFTEFPIYR